MGSPSLAPRRYRASHIGRIREKLAEIIVAAHSEHGIQCIAEPENLRPQQGAWRTDFRLDVCRWEGRIKVLKDGVWSDASIQSWSTMSDCVRFGVTVEPGDAPWWIEIESKDDIRAFRKRKAGVNAS